MLVTFYNLKYISRLLTFLSLFACTPIHYNSMKPIKLNQELSKPIPITVYANDPAEKSQYSVLPNRQL